MSPRYGGGYGGGYTGLGDVAAIGQGLLGGTSYALDLGSQLKRLMIAEDEQKSREDQRRLNTRLQAFELGAKYPEYGDQIPQIFGDQAPDLGPDVAQRAEQARAADALLSDLVATGDYEKFQQAASGNPLIRQRLGRNPTALKTFTEARERHENERAFTQQQAEVQRLMTANPGMSEAEARRAAAAAGGYRGAQQFEKTRHLMPPELSPADRIRLAPGFERARAEERARGAILDPDAPYNLADIGETTDGGTMLPDPGQLQLRVFGEPPAGPPPETPRAPMPGRARTIGDIERARAEARVPQLQRDRFELDKERSAREAERLGLERQRVGRDAERLGLERQRVDLQARDVATRESEAGRRTTKDQQVRERLGATLKTFESMAIDTAKKSFPDDPVKQMALAEKLRTRLRSFDAILGQDKDTAQIEQELRDEIAKAKGEFVRMVPEARPQVDGYFQNIWNSVTGVGRAVFGGAPGRSAPGRPAVEPQVTAPPAEPGASSAASPNALRSASDAMVNALYPGRSWGQLSPEEKQAVADRLNGR